MPDALELLAHLAEAGIRAGTRHALLRQLGAVLASSHPFHRLELGRKRTPTAISRFHRLILDSASGSITEEEGVAGGPEIQHALATGEPRLTQPFPLEEGARRLLLPLATGETRDAFLALTFREAPADPALLERPFLRAMSRVLGAVIHQHQRLERVAVVSRRAHSESRRLRLQGGPVLVVPEFVADSRAMQEVLEKAWLVAKHGSPVLLRGETGTGKERIARWIHEESARKKGPFHAINCGAIPETLIESELFGHEAGAFTGATRRHLGRIERAAGGTLFLDEVGDLPLAAQVKLLRILQEGRFERLGGESEIVADVRLMAATHRSLEEMCERGEFRSDLFYRLEVFPLWLPPLRERPEDMPGLVERLLRDLAQRLSRPMPRVGRATLADLAARRWPGNVRQLANILERALILSPGDELHLPPDSGDEHEARSRSGGGGVSGPSRAETFREASRRSIEAALRRTGGKVAGADGAARLLGLNVSTLQSKIKKLDIDRRRFARRP